MPTPSAAVLFKATTQGSLDDLRAVLAQGADLTSVRRGQSVLVTALKHRDPKEATRRAVVLLEAGADWQGASNQKVKPLSLILSRRLAGVLPALARLRGVSDFELDTGQTFVGQMAVDQWLTGLRAWAAAGGNIRWTMTPWKKRLPTVALLMEGASPRDDEAGWPAWVETARWMMEQPKPAEDDAAFRVATIGAMVQARARLGNARFDALQKVWFESPGWWDEETARMAIFRHLQAASGASWAGAARQTQVTRFRDEAWGYVRHLVEERGVPLSNAGDQFKTTPALQLLLAATGYATGRPRALRASLEKVAWALEHGASVSDRSEGALEQLPVWLYAFQHARTPWEAMRPLRSHGLDPTAPVEIATRKNPSDLFDVVSTPLGHALAGYNQNAVLALVAEQPGQAHQVDRLGRNLLLHTLALDFGSQSFDGRILPFLKAMEAAGVEAWAPTVDGQTAWAQLVANPSTDRLSDFEEALEWFHERANGAFDRPDAGGLTPWQHLKATHPALPLVRRWDRLRRLSRLPVPAEAQPARARL